MNSFRSHLWQAAKCGRQYFDDETEAQGKVTCLGSEHSDILQHNAQSAAGRRKAHPGLPCTLSLPPVPCGAFFGQREPSSGPPDVAFMKAHFHHQRGLPCISLDPLLLSGQKPTSPPPLCSLWEAGKGDSELREGQQKHLRQAREAPHLTLSFSQHRAWWVLEATPSSQDLGLTFQLPRAPACSRSPSPTGFTLCREKVKPERDCGLLIQSQRPRTSQLFRGSLINAA